MRRQSHRRQSRRRQSRRRQSRRRQSHRRQSRRRQSRRRQLHSSSRKRRSRVSRKRVSRKRVSRKRVSRKRVSRKRAQRSVLNRSRRRQYRMTGGRFRRNFHLRRPVSPLRNLDIESNLEIKSLFNVLDPRYDETRIRYYTPIISVSGLDHCAEFTDPKECTAINPDRKNSGDLYAGDCYWDFDKKWCRNIEKRWAKEKPSTLNPKYEGLTNSEIAQIILKRDDEMRERTGGDTIIRKPVISYKRESIQNPRVLASMSYGPFSSDTESIPQPTERLERERLRTPSSSAQDDRYPWGCIVQ